MSKLFLTVWKCPNEKEERADRKTKAGKWIIQRSTAQVDITIAIYTDDLDLAQYFT